MRWYWIDRFTEFTSGHSATAIKNVSLSEEHLHDHWPGLPTMPNSLIIEGLAQTGGLLVAEHSRFEARVVLAKLSRAVFHARAEPGDTLQYRVVLQSVSKEGAVVTGTSYLGERLQGEVEIFFAHLPEEFAGKSLFEPEQFLAMLEQLGVFRVGRNADGTPIEIPPALLASVA